MSLGRSAELAQRTTKRTGRRDLLSRFSNAHDPTTIPAAEKELQWIDGTSTR